MFDSLLVEFSSLRLCMYLVTVEVPFSMKLKLLDLSKKDTKVVHFWGTSIRVLLNVYINEPLHQKTNNLHMRKQRRRSASQ